MFLVFVRRYFIEVGVAIGLLTSMLLGFGSAAIAATFPDTPSIISPEDGATAVPVAPTIQATPLADLQESKWMIYQPDASLQILGGVQSSSSATFVADATGEFQEIGTPVAITIDGTSVAKLRIYAIGKLEALDESDTVLGRVTAQVDGSHYLPSTASPYTLIKTYSDAVSVRWFFAHDTHGEVALEALLTADGRAALRVSPSAVTEGLYTLSDGAAGCALRVNSILREENESLAGWKAVFDAEDFADFSLLCRAGGGSILLGTLAQPAIPVLALPAIQTLTSTADTLTIISEEDELESGTQYQVQVRYETTGGDFSNWSDPVSFTTEIDTDYQVDLGGNVDFEFTAGEPRVLTVNVSNEGADAGQPTLQVRLPFNVLDGLDGAASDFYSISGCGSSVVINGGASVLSCDLAELAAESSVDVTVTLTLKEDVDAIEYRVCEQGLCDEAPYESLAVSVVAGVTPPASGGSSSSSSSSGGAFWYLLVVLPVFGIFRKS